MANVFISHRGSDLVFAEKIAEEVRKVGHQVWLDKWEIKIGDSIVEKIGIGLRDATHLILCYSSAGIDSPWMGREWMSALARSLSGSGVKILPVKLNAGLIPEILFDYKYIDLSTDWTKGMQELQDALR